MPYTVTIATPYGNTRTATAKTLREAGQRVAWCLDDNTRIGRKEATRHGMEAERTGRTEAEGYVFHITKEPTP